METRTRYTFTKEERLYRQGDFDRLLAGGKSFISYPVRVVYRCSPRRENDFPARMAVSVSKKRFKRAVKRNRIKRLIREAYRLNKALLYEWIPADCTIDILFIYLESEVADYKKIEKAIKGAFKKMHNSIEKRDGNGDDMAG